MEIFIDEVRRSQSGIYLMQKIIQRSSAGEVWFYGKPGRRSTGDGLRIGWEGSTDIEGDRLSRGSSC